WKNKPDQAIPIYNELNESNPASFGIQLGLANSYSMSKEYPLAYRHISNAITTDPDNQQAHVSAKYIRLGFANQLASQYHLYDSALHLVHENLKDDPQDQESIALMANIHIISKEYGSAKNAYLGLKDDMKSLIGQSTVLHLQGYDEEALEIANQLLEMTDQMKDSAKISQVKFHYISALLWNNQLKEAANFLEALSSGSKDPIYLAKEAEIAMYEADFIKGQKSYGKYLSTFPKSFDGNLGKANAHYALGMDNRAYSMAFHAAELFPGQLDVEGFINKLNQRHSPYISSEYLFGTASDKSTVVGWTNQAKTSLTPLLSIQASYTHKEFTPPGEGAKSTSKSMNISAHQQISQRLRLNMSVGNVSIEIPESSVNPNRIDVDASADIWVSKLQKLNVGFETEIQDFNAALINQNLRTNHVFMKNNMFWKRKNIGWYTELYRSYFSDSNRRNLIFTSLYKSIPKKVKYKVGANFLLMNFKESKPVDYFSPLSFTKIEAFSGLEFTKPNVVSVLFDIAGGIQFVDGLTQGNWRTQASVNKAIGRLNIYLKGLYTTISEVQGAGF
ncbi:MAG: hypothetical protein AAFY41_10670, partial [Bacteroidota bacterium]